jgi:hypothetical protein
VDVADASLEGAGNTDDPKQKAALLKLSLDASNAALRCWRTLKFPTPEGVRRPGRPSGDSWNRRRKVNANSALREVSNA